MEVVNMLTRTADDARYVIDARLHQMRRVNGQTHRALVCSVEKDFNVLAIHHGLVEMMVQREGNALLLGLLAKFR
jgi:hypothetical protein